MIEDAKKTVEHAGTVHEAVRYTHDSFGVITLSKVSSNKPTALFGSALKHRNYVVIELSRANLARRHNRDWISDVGEDDIVRFAMSEAQWAQFVSSMGMGSGTPVTLERAPARGTRIEGMPQLRNEPLRETFENEIRDAAAKASESVREVQEQLKNYLKPGVKPPNKKDIEELMSTLNAAGAHLSSNLGWIQRNFAESMENTVESAKADIEAFVSSVALNTGLESLRNGASPVLLESAPVETDDTD